TLSNFLLPLGTVYRRPELEAKTLRTCGENNMIVWQIEHFSCLPFINDQEEDIDDTDHNLRFELFIFIFIFFILILKNNTCAKSQKSQQHIIHVHIIQSKKKSKDREMQKQHFDRLENVLYHLNEDTPSANEFGWLKEQNTSFELREKLLPSMLCDIAAHSISSLEARFRSCHRKEILTKLPLQLQLNNTAVSSIWKLFATHFFGAKTGSNDFVFDYHGMNALIQSSWKCLSSLFGGINIQLIFLFLMYIHYVYVLLLLLKKLDISLFFVCNESLSSDSKDYDEVLNTQEPFHVLVRAFLTHPYLFYLHRLDDVAVDANVMHDIRASNTVNDIHHALLGCYLWKILQVLLGDIPTQSTSTSTSTDESREQVEEGITLLPYKLHEEGSRKSVMKRLYFFVLPFLRKCYMLLYSCGLIELDLDLLWSCLSVDNTTLSAILAKDWSVFQLEKVMTECDSICEALFLPTIETYVMHCFGTNPADESCEPYPISTQALSGVLCIMHCWTQTFLGGLTQGQCRHILSTRDMDSILPISLEMCDPKCSSGHVSCKSAICLFCGAFLCTECRRNQKGILTIHSKHCGQGKGIFLLLQDCTILLLYEHATVVFNSPYLNRYGESDISQKYMMSLSNLRLYELWKLVADEAIPNKVCQLGDSQRPRENL
ncbi:hypothetical protein RFI_30047, partial [Reticulomyxa filosa]